MQFSLLLVSAIIMPLTKTELHLHGWISSLHWILDVSHWGFFWFVFNFTTLTNIAFKTKFRGYMLFWCCFGFVSSLQSWCRCVWKDRFCYGLLRELNALQFRLDKIFIGSVLYLTCYCHYWWFENFIALLYWQTDLLVKGFTARETLQILAFRGYGKV